MQDLNDLYYFVQVVEHRGFAPAGRALGISKSKLSRRVAALEERLGVRLLQRSTRRFSVTEIGQNYHAHCRAMLVEAQAAEASITRVRAEPCGVVRLSCPVALLHVRVSAMLAAFMAAYPRVQLHVEATNRRVDVIGEGLDIAIRARPDPLEDSELRLKRLTPRARQCLVASPAFLGRFGSIAVPADLGEAPGLDRGSPRPEYVWNLEGPDGARAAIRHASRLVTDDLLALRTAALAGIGVASLPQIMVIDELRADTLVRLLPGWAPRAHVVHAVYPSQRGLLPAVRALLDHLGRCFDEIAES